MYDDVGLRKWSVKQAAKILQFEDGDVIETATRINAFLRENTAFEDPQPEYTYYDVKPGGPSSLREYRVTRSGQVQFEGKGGHWKPSRSYNTVEELLYYYEVRA